MLTPDNPGSLHARAHATEMSYVLLISEIGICAFVQARCHQKAAARDLKAHDLLIHLFLCVAGRAVDGS